MKKRPVLLTTKIATLPKKPGVYVFRDGKGKVLYVGKAKVLANRVRSYFQKNANLEERKKIMVQDIRDLETFIVPSETDALLLEATLIHEHWPPYNVILKDDKSFLYIRVTMSEAFPTVDTVRTITNKKDAYFGPFTSAAAARDTVRLLKRIFRFRTCEPHAGRPCFDYTIKRCLGVCIDAISQAAYREVMQQLTTFLKGKSEDVVALLKKEMQQAADRRAFEYAALIRDRIGALTAVMQRQVVVAPNTESCDVLGLYREKHNACVSVLWVRNGRLTNKQTLVMSQAASATDGDIMQAFIEQYYLRVPDRPRNIYTAHLPTLPQELNAALQIRITKIARGRIRALQLNADENAKQALVVHLASYEKDERKRTLALTNIQKLLRLSHQPKRIEAFDIANISGKHATGSMVVFIDGKPAKRFYKRFSIKTVDGSNDPAMLAEIVLRRLLHLSSGDAGWETPDLLLLDGGKGQLSVVQTALKGKYDAIPIVAIAKGGHAKPTEQAERERFFLQDGSEIRIERSDALYLIERIRDESHRFATSFYQKKHGASARASSLDAIPGIGPKTKKILLKSFGSVGGIQRASDIELIRIVGETLTKAIRAHL